MGVPGIVTLPFRLAVNKFGADKVNAWLSEANQQTVARGAGINPSTPEGTAAAASLIDRTVDTGSSKPAATPGAIGTGSIAAQASAAVADALKDSGLPDDQIANFAQRAADAVISGADMNTAVNNAKTAASEAILTSNAGTMGGGLYESDGLAYNDNVSYDGGLRDFDFWGSDTDALFGDFGFGDFVGGGGGGPRGTDWADTAQH
jgi:hypothetical protein